MVANRKPIQEQFGERVINAFAEFARADLRTASELEAEEFLHVSDPQLRRALAQALYGVRWLYKLGLALLAKDEERAAHIRAQVVDYASVCEGLLSDAVAHAIVNRHVAGESYKWADPDRKLRPLDWTTHNPVRLLGKQPLWWLIRVSRDCDVVDGKLARDLDWLRRQRNAVHLRQRVALGQYAFLSQSRRAFQVVARTIRQTRIWKVAHP